ncbi:hypothetical protein FQN54_005960 [Arachnomyces sp. PD_36]|nr:hypothetical protein FQN54_005960 [Arachnomyces sp. PD_36]
MTLIIPQAGYSPLAQLHPRLICVDKLPLRNPIPTPRTRRHASSSSAPPQSQSQPPKKRLWLRLSVLTVAAAAVGAYIRSYEDASGTVLNPVTFTRYKLVSKQPTSSTISIFHLEPTNPGCGENKIYEEAWQKGIWSVQFKQPQLQIGRDYTPLPPPPGSAGENIEEDGSLRFLIRRDPRGEVSGYIHSLGEGSTLEIRGPQTECELPSDIEDVLFIAGGTGIAPAFQAAETMFRRRKSGRKPRMHILWANRRKEDCAGGISDLATSSKQARSWWSRLSGFYKSEPVAPPPTSVEEDNAMVKELEVLKSEYPGRITVDYFVDEENSFIGKDSILDFTKESRPIPEGEQPGKKLILISGPEGFVNYFAGPKVWDHGKAVQGPLRGVLQQLHLNGWSIWKL